MKTVHLLLSACLVLPFATACQKEDTQQNTAAVQAPLAAPTTQDENEWNAYLTDVVTRNLDGATSTYVYTLPAENSPDFQGFYDRQLEKATADAARGGVEGTLLAYGSPTSAKTADLAVASLSKAMPASMKGVKVLFIGDAVDSERVKAATAPSEATYQFVEMK